MIDPTRIRRLRWMCRRGMKELDLLLESFLAVNQAALGAGEWPELERLLNCEDNRLWDSLRGATDGLDAEFEPLIHAIRQADGSRP